MAENKISDLWAYIFSLSEDDNASGRVSFSRKYMGEGHQFITIDGRRYLIEIALDRELGASKLALLQRCDTLTADLKKARKALEETDGGEG